jgi:hypothetical protein
LLIGVDFEGAIAMRKYLVAATLFAVCATPAFAAETFYVGYNGKRCQVFHNKTPDGWKMLGDYRSQHDAQRAMHNMKQCEKD